MYSLVERIDHLATREEVQGVLSDLAAYIR
jgi:hypothetical protein